MLVLQALFDMSMLDYHTAEVAANCKRFKTFVADICKQRTLAVVEQQVKQASRAEREARTSGMCLLSLEHLKQLGIDMPTDEVIDQGFFLPCVDDCVLSNLK